MARAVFRKHSQRSLKLRRRAKRKNGWSGRIRNSKRWSARWRWNLKKTIGKASSPAKHCYRRIRCPGFADYPAAQSRASILGLSPDLGISLLCRTIENQQKARLPAASRKRFARQRRREIKSKADNSAIKAAP